jgi:threonine/homoserine/homoserine lactone efflux protein
VLAYLTQGLLLGGAAAVQPGPFQALLLSLSLNYGWRRAVPAAFAPLISDGPILILVLVVLTQLPVWFVSVLQIGGGIFLLYLAWGAYLAVRSAGAIEADDLPPPSGSVLKAALTNLLSPNPYIFWATVAGPILIGAWRESPSNGIAFLLGFYAALIGGMIAFVLVFSAAGQIGPRVNRALGWFAALALLGFGLFQLVRGISGLGAAGQ